MPPKRAKAEATPETGIAETHARALAEAWRKRTVVSQTIEATKTGWQVANMGTQLEYVAESGAIVVRHGVGVNYNAPITDPDAMRAKLAAETESQAKMLGGTALELAILPHRHLDPLVKNRGVKPALEIVTTRTIRDGAIDEDAFVEAVRKVTKAAVTWRKKRDLLFRAGR